MSEVERCVVRAVVRRLVADDVHDRRTGPACVVQVRDPVAQAGAEVQERRGRRTGHAAVAVGRAGGDAFEQRRGCARISGTSSSAATNCISDVPGFAKHTSTPFATRVRMSACAPFIESSIQECQSSNVPGFRMPFGSNAALMRRIERDLGRILELEEVALLRLADAVLRRDRATELQSGLEDRVHDLVPLVGVALEHREVHVAVARVPAPAIHVACSSAIAATVAMYSGTDARGTTTSMMSLAPFCLATQNAFSRASSSSAAECDGKHVHVDRAEFGEQLGDGGRVLVEPIAVVLSR